MTTNLIIPFSNGQVILQFLKLLGQTPYTTQCLEVMIGKYTARKEYPMRKNYGDKVATKNTEMDQA